MTKNYQDDHGVTDVNSPDIRCFQMRSGTGTASVSAGGELGFIPDQGVTHPGPVQFYMARVPEGKDINTWEAAGNVWFKVASINGVNPGAKTSGFTWPTYSQSSPIYRSLLSLCLSLSLSIPISVSIFLSLYPYPSPYSTLSSTYLLRVCIQSPGREWWTNFNGL